MSEFKNHDYIDEGGTFPRKESVESSLEHRLRAIPGRLHGCKR